MTVTTILLTLNLSLVIGVYMLAAGTLGLVSTARWRAIVADLRASAAVTYLTGLAAFAIGAAILIVHNNWTDLLAIVITLLAWIATLEGLVLIVAPLPMLNFADRLMNNGTLRIVCIASVVLGVILVALGLIGTAGPGAATLPPVEAAPK